MNDRDRPHLAEVLDLAPHPEGGWFRETWRSPVAFAPPGLVGERASATCIYFLLNPGEESAWHRVRSAELWMWHGPGTLALDFGGDGDIPSSAPTTVTLGMNLEAGDVPHAVVPPDTWQAARPVGDEPVVVSCVVSPGFDFTDFALADEQPGSSMG